MGTSALQIISWATREARDINIVYSVNILSETCLIIAGKSVQQEPGLIGVPEIGYKEAAKSLQSCPTLCNPTDGSPPGSPVPGILQARTLEWVAISFSNVWKWSRSVVSDPQWPHGLQPTRLLRPWDFPGKSTGVGCHCLLWQRS